LKLRSAWPEHHGFWSEAPCRGCQRPLCTPDPEQRLCPDCRLEMGVHLASQLDPTADVEPRPAPIPRPGKVLHLDRELLAAWLASTEPAPVGETFPQERASVVLEWYHTGWELDGPRLAAAVEAEIERLTRQRKKRR
jgi:hypothetical protein